MGRGVALLFALGACGRIGFDALSEDARPIDAAVTDTPDALDGLVCAPLACTAAAATNVCNGRCFSTCYDSVDFPTAAAACVQWGGKLAVIRDMVDEDCLRAILPGGAWIGFVQASGAANPGDNWGWIDGTPTTYVLWRGLEPNDGDNVENDNENCGMNYGGATGDWNDSDCSGSRGYACSR